MRPHTTSAALHSGFRSTIGWRFIYKIYPPILRILEKAGVHSGRQEFPLGFFNKKYNSEDFQSHLRRIGFETALLAWKDTDEVFGMRKLHNNKFQWHIRMFSNGEIRGHYEYAPEGNPIYHIFEKMLVSEKDFFISVICEYLEKTVSMKEL
ncbi:MAG: hypothetical protein AAB602_02605 [Patescibacteria group bacterium]